MPGYGDDPLVALAREDTVYTVFAELRIPLVSDIEGPSTYVFDWAGEQLRLTAADEPPPHAQLVDVTSDEEGIHFRLGDPPASGGGTPLPPFTFVVRDLPVLVSGGSRGDVGSLAFRFDAPVSALEGLPSLGEGDSLLTFTGGLATVRPLWQLGLLSRSALDLTTVTSTAQAIDPFAAFDEPSPNVTYSAAPVEEYRSDLAGEPEPTFDLGVLGPSPPMNITATAMPADFDEPTSIGLGPAPVRQRPWLKLGAGVAGVLAVLAVGGVLLLGGDDEQTTAPPTPPPEAELPSAWAQPSGLVADAGGTPLDDPAGDFVYSIPGIAPGDPAPDVDILGARAGTVELSDAQAAALSAEPAYACGAAAACADDDAPLPAGTLFVFDLSLAGAPPADAGATDHTYALVLDANGDPADDFAFVAPFEWDFYQGTDRWYELKRDGGDWALSVQRWRNDRAVLAPSAARAVLSGETITWLVPGSELMTPDPGWRATAFRHDGTFEPQASAGDVTGADPTQPLAHLGR
jgi:hypothetical protein